MPKHQDGFETEQKGADQALIYLGVKPLKQREDEGLEVIGKGLRWP
jgi:hypothetical protein